MGSRVKRRLAVWAVKWGLRVLGESPRMFWELAVLALNPDRQNALYDRLIQADKLLDWPPA